MLKRRVSVRGLMRVGGAVLAAGAILLAAGPVGAASNCKARIVKKTGLIKVSADSVDPGTLAWGNVSGQEVNNFYDPACIDVVTLKARNCTLAGPTLLASKTPPRDCTVYVTDVNGSCEAWIPGCVPGVRQGRAILGYVWADQPTMASYTPSPVYQFNSTGGTNTIQRFGAGNYQVTFPDLGSSLSTPPHRHVIVNPYANYAGPNVTCVVGYWEALFTPPDLTVQVYCYASTGTPTDNYFTVQVIE